MHCSIGLIIRLGPRESVCDGIYVGIRRGHRPQLAGVFIVRPSLQETKT